MKGLALRSAAAVAAAVVAAALLAPGRTAPATAAPKAPRPNIVFVLADDLSWNLVQYMPQVQRMQREGATFTNYFVTDSLCCPSRASIFTGLFPHNHGVLTNTAPSGGFAAFRAGAQRETFATALQDGGYRTAMMGKYLNGYHPKGHYVPPGWSNWQVSGSAYGGFDYTLSENGHATRFGSSPRAYITDVLARRGSAFVRRVSRAQDPFFLEVASYAPHHPYTPAPRHRYAFPGLTAPHTAAYDAANRNAPAWLRDRAALDPTQTTSIDEAFRKRAQSVLALDQLVGRVREQLRRSGMDRNTYVVFSSDNGFHLGEHRLTAGKMTAFDTDIRVPLVVVGPGVAAGQKIDELTENVDLAPTFMRLAGVTPPPDVDGRGLVGLLHGQHPRPWRGAVLVEHHHPPTPEGDPDRQSAPSGNPPSYQAVRTRAGTYVEYDDGEHEWYDLRTDPDQLDNTYDQLAPDARDHLQRLLEQLSACWGRGCWDASLP